VNDWAFFATIFAQFDVQFLAAVNAMIGQVLDVARAPLVAAITVWLAGSTIDELLHPGGEPLLRLVRKAIRAGVVVIALTAATYNQLAGQMLLTELPNGITAAITGATGAPQLAPAAFDHVWGAAWASGLEVYKNLPSWSLKGVALGILVGLYFIGAMLAISVAFLIFVASHILLGLVIAVGPLFVALFLFERTQRFFNGWIGTVLSLIMLQVFVVGILGLLINVETQIVKEIAGANGAAGVNANDEITQLKLIIEAFAVFAMMAFLTTRLPGLAGAVMSGVAADIAPISHMVHSALYAGTAGPAVSAARAAGSGVRAGSAAAMRSIRASGAAP